jgi:hypothetical protein
VARNKADGLDAVEPRSRRPKSNPRATGDKVREFIIRTRLELTAAGWDAGPVTIAWHLEQAGLHVPSTSTIRRILHAAGRMHHLGIGTAHRGKEILALADQTNVTVIELQTSEVLSAHDIDPSRAYWRTKQRSPGRWPGPTVT